MIFKSSVRKKQKRQKEEKNAKSDIIFFEI